MILEVSSIKESLMYQLSLLETLVVKDKLKKLGTREKEFIALFYICTEGKKMDKNSPDINKIISKEMKLDRTIVWGFTAKLKTKGWMIQTPTGVELVSYAKLLQLKKNVQFQCDLKLKD